MLLQMPVFLALYRLVYNVPAYVSSVKSAFDGIVEGIISTPGYQDTLDKFVETAKLTAVRADFHHEDLLVVKNYIVDTVYKMSTSAWDTLRDAFPNLIDVIDSTEAHLNHINYFLGMNISDSPFAIITNSMASHSYLLVFLALMVPITSYASQMLNVKLMPQADTDPDSAMSKQLKTMNYTMPLFSLVLCFTVPVGLGIYWIFSSLTSGVQQYFVNKAYSYRKTANPNSLTAKANLVKDFNERNNK